MDTINYFHIVRKRLITLGVKPKHAREVSLNLSTQVKSMGIYNALDYFKRVGDAITAYISKSGVRPQWVRLDKDGFPSKFSCLKDYDVAILLRVSKMARVLCLSSPTKAMVDKLREAATSPYKGTEEGLSELSRLISLGIKHVAIRNVPFPRGFGSVVSQARTFVSRSVPTGTAVGLDINNILSVFRQNRSWITDVPSWDSVMYPLHPSWVGRESIGVTPYQFAGEIGGVMENGGKLRLFAAPSVLLQCFLEPLQKWLDGIRVQLPYDVFKHQEAGATWAQDKMMSGHEVQSIDLSSATCRFPFSAQLELLGVLGAPAWAVRAFEHVSRMPWVLQPHMAEWMGVESITWSVGQPLGIAPSMSSFALCHGLLLAGLCIELGIPVTDSFRVLGDDVVTADRRLSERYRAIMRQLSVGISEHKCHQSMVYAEFAGFSVTPTVMVRPGRWRAPTWLNVMGLVTDLSAAVINELPPSDRLVATLLAFQSGAYLPSVEDWSAWVRLSTAVPDVAGLLRYRDKELSWFDGAVAWLQRQFPQSYFTEARTQSFLDGLELSEDLLECVGPLLRSMEILSGFLPPGQHVNTVLYWAERLLGAAEYADLMLHLKVQYEEYLWSLPQTDGRKARDQWRSVQAAVETAVLEIPAFPM
jgi:hypothetical protein